MKPQNSSIFTSTLFILITASLSATILPINNLYTSQIATHDLTTFTKINGCGGCYQTIISTYPVVRNATTTVTIKITGSSQLVLLGCGQKNTNILSSQYFGQSVGNLAYDANSGQKYISGAAVPYSVTSCAGDFITMKIDLHAQEMNV
jgi:hypothetical protein